MRENVVHEYVDEVVETRRRTIQIIEDVHAEITAWHGERFLCDISGWTSVAAAIQEAEKQAKRFKVDKGSTLVLRVSERRRVVSRKPRAQAEDTTPMRTSAMTRSSASAMSGIAM